MKLKLILISPIILISSNGFIDWLQNHLLTCPFKKFSGLDCPGCGLQRSILALMQGDLVSSFKLYPPTLLIIVLLMFTLLHLKFDFRMGAFFIKVLYISITFVIVINYIYKIVNHQLI